MEVGNRREEHKSRNKKKIEKVAISFTLKEYTSFPFYTFFNFEIQTQYLSTIRSLLLITSL